MQDTTGTGTSAAGAGQELDERVRARDTVCLIGMRGAGKTSVGKALAPLLERPFIDLDDRVLSLARHAGHHATSVAELLRAGVNTFRELESQALRTLCEPQVRCVLATGGGTLERADNRTWLARTALVVWLRARVETLEERIASAGYGRPALLGSDPVAEVAELCRRREPAYAAAAHLVFDSDGDDPRALAERIRERIAARAAAEPSAS